MYEWLSETLERNGYVQYEISNWAKPGHECRHNLQYWRGLPYLAFGAGAHGYANGYRYSNVLRIKTYIDRLTNHQSTSHQFTNYQPASSHFPLTPVTVNHHRQSLQDDMSEFMMTGLRLTREGVSPDEFQARFQQSLYEVYGTEVKELLALGLIENGAGKRIKISRHGRLLGNQVFLRFL
jgi:oxygen-independent coproporphyrinogen-3 oxidase